MRTNRLHLLLLALTTIALVAILVGCAPGGERDGERGSATGGENGAPLVALGEVRTNDTSLPLSSIDIDQTLEGVYRHIPAVRYLLRPELDSIRSVRGGGDSIASTIVDLQLARFGSILATELRFRDLGTGKTDRRLGFSVLRYRDSSNQPLPGPSLYDAIYRAVGRRHRLPHTSDSAVATEPLIVGAIEIERGATMGKVGEERVKIAEQGVRALAEFARLHYPELVAFDYEGRGELYRLVGIGAVEDFMPVADAERRAMYAVGIDTYVTGRIAPTGRDSFEVSVRLHRLTAANRVAVVDSASKRFPRTSLNTSDAVGDAVVALIDVVEPLYAREAERVRQRYQEERNAD